MLARYDTWQGVSCSPSLGRRQWLEGQREKEIWGQGENLLLLSLPLHVPLCNRYQALQLGGLGHDEVEDDPHILEESSKSSQLISPVEKYIQCKQICLQAVMWAAEQHQPGDRTLRDTVGADDPQIMAHSDCKGIKSRVSFVLGPSSGGGGKTLELLCCYLIIVPRLNCLKDLWVWDSALGNLQSNWWGSMVWLWLWGV